MIEVHKVKGEVYCDCCKQRAVVRITAANFSACNPTNITLCEDCLNDLKGKIDHFLNVDLTIQTVNPSDSRQPETHATPEMIAFLLGI